MAGMFVRASYPRMLLEPPNAKGTEGNELEKAKEVR
jgi:hypothetical protein